MKTRALISYVLLALSVISYAQQTHIYPPGKIRQKLEKLKVLGSVLYVAAHPDDENTRLIAYYANGELMRTAYLSATRGDGGQNLVGPQIREELGLIRTQELLAARRIDGGRQIFTRANDFGYSKTPDETFNIWDREKVLGDFVWAFRKFRPDIVVTRFSDTGRSHGHHTASAILAREAFGLSGDENAYSEQLDYVEPWQPKKIFWNTGWWWFRNGEMDTSKLVTLDVGGYNALLGESYTEIAARSRSMHKSQGFGSSGSRGEQIEYLEKWDGDKGKLILRGAGSKGQGKWLFSSIKPSGNTMKPTLPQSLARYWVPAKHWKRLMMTSGKKSNSGKLMNWSRRLLAFICRLVHQPQTIP